MATVNGKCKIRLAALRDDAADGVREVSMVRRFSFLLVVPVLLLGRVASPQGNPVGPQFRVNTYTTGAQIEPQVAVDSAGDFVVAWESTQEDPQDPATGIFGQRYAASGVPLGLEFRVNTYTTSFQVHPSLASDPSGNFLVAWDGHGSSGDGAFEIFAQRYDSSGVTLGTEFRVNTWTTGGQNHPAVAANPDGTFVVLWSGSSPGLGIVGQRYAASGAPIGPEFIVSTQVGEYPAAVASDALGNFVVLWERYGGGTEWDIFGRRCDSTGGVLGPEFRVNTYTTSDQKRPSVASDAAGSFVVVWDSDHNDPGSNWDVFGQRFASSGAPLGSEFRVNAATLWDQAYATVASDTSGNFVVVWTGFPPGFAGIQGQRYSSSGAPLGQDFDVATGGRLPDVAVDALGNFVVVWHTNQQDGSNYGVFGQRFNQIVPVELMHFQVE